MLLSDCVNNHSNSLKGSVVHQTSNSEDMRSHSQRHSELLMAGESQTGHLLVVHHNIGTTTLNNGLKTY